MVHATSVLFVYGYLGGAVVGRFGRKADIMRKVRMWVKNSQVLEYTQLKTNIAVPHVVMVFPRVATKNLCTRNSAKQISVIPLVGLYDVGMKGNDSVTFTFRPPSLAS